MNTNTNWLEILETQRKASLKQHADLFLKAWEEYKPLIIENMDAVKLVFSGGNKGSVSFEGCDVVYKKESSPEIKENTMIFFRFVEAWAKQACEMGLLDCDDDISIENGKLSFFLKKDPIQTSTLKFKS